MPAAETDPPTAWHASAAGQATLDSKLLFPVATGAGLAVQAVPFQYSARGRPDLGGRAPPNPTATHDDGEVQARAASAPEGLVALALGVIRQPGVAAAAAAAPAATPPAGTPAVVPTTTSHAAPTTAHTRLRNRMCVPSPNLSPSEP